jgi:hypothetical protein
MLRAVERAARGGRTAAAAGALVLALVAGSAGAQPSGEQRPVLPATAGSSRASSLVGRDAPDLRELVARPQSEMAAVVSRYATDRDTLSRTYPVQGSPVRRERMAAFYASWLTALDAIDFPALSAAGKADLVLLRNLVRREQKLHEFDGRRESDAAGSLPFAPVIYNLAESRRRATPVEYEKVAGEIVKLKAAVEEARKKFGEAAPGPAVSKTALDQLRSLRWAFSDWRSFYNEYDPQFSWWMGEPCRAADGALVEYERTIREKGLGRTEGNENNIVGIPIGRDGLVSELAFEMIPYTPEELVAIAEKEFAWCEAEYRKAARDMGLGDDWRAALEKVKQDHVAPGEQAQLIRDLAIEAIDYVKGNNLVTVPPMAEETWRMRMMSAEQQLVSPFFLGGEVIQVSFPTSEMQHEQKLMSLRGNNRHFSRATVQHELIPGHHLQQFMQSRERTYRGPFETPFWTEGWALYWEMLLWDKGFPKTPENRVGMLFWRSHRCARIIFSLKFHLGEWTPQQCVDYLVERVGHERANAEGEVRRSVSGDYSPLYQIAYMIGGLEFRALHKELVESGKMSDRDFHDAVLKENNIPVAMVREILSGREVAKEFKADWRFYPVVEPSK